MASAESHTQPLTAVEHRLLLEHRQLKVARRVFDIAWGSSSKDGAPPQSSVARYAVRGETGLIDTLAWLDPWQNGANRAVWLCTRVANMADVAEGTIPRTQQHALFTEEAGKPIVSQIDQVHAALPAPQLRRVFDAFDQILTRIEEAPVGSPAANTSIRP